MSYQSLLVLEATNNIIYSFLICTEYQYLYCFIHVVSIGTLTGLGQFFLFRANIFNTLQWPNKEYHASVTKSAFYKLHFSYVYSCKVNIDIQKYRAKCIVLSELFCQHKIICSQRRSYFVSSGCSQKVYKLINLVNFKSITKIDEVLLYQRT